MFYILKKRLTHFPLSGSQIEQWFYDRTGVILSSNVKVKGAASDKTVSVASRSANSASGEACWPGKTCDALLQEYEELLDRVYAPIGVDQQTPQQQRQHEKALEVWRRYAIWLIVATGGCNDHDLADRTAHAEELQQLAEEFIDAFRQAAGLGKGTVYMHEMLCHVKDTVLEFGSLVKFSCQGFEAMHQLLKNYARNHSNRKVADTANTVLKRILCEFTPNTKLRNTQGKKHGGIEKKDKEGKVYISINSGHLSLEALDRKRNFINQHMEEYECIKRQRQAKINM